jgi:hypothetical protein
VGAKRGYARSRLLALERVHFVTAAFVALRWDAIERVANELLQREHLTAHRVQKLTDGAAR